MRKASSFCFKEWMAGRNSGILCHVSSLPSRFGVGDFGPDAFAFADFLHRAGQRCWQVLPLSPVNGGAGNSPYSGYSAFAGNPLFISPEQLVRDGRLAAEELARVPEFSGDVVEYDAVRAFKMKVLDRAFDQALPRLRTMSGFVDFRERNRGWLEEYALFAALKEHFQGRPWYAWPEPIRLREPQAVAVWREKLSYWVLREIFFQYLFHEQWEGLRRYCNGLDIRIMGDIPIYVSLDSCDVWSGPELFELDDEHRPIYAAGAPPDYFSETGQLWGNPVYDWGRQEKSGFSWWVERIRHAMVFYDMVRLDHFRGFAGFWQVPACEETAENGVWIPGPGSRLFDTLNGALGEMPLIAEDLGVITDDVRELMQRYGFPGMRVLQFAFDGDFAGNGYLPHNYEHNTVVYTGTHDNNTVAQWFRRELDADRRGLVRRYLGYGTSGQEVGEGLVRLATASVAGLCIIPLQDVPGVQGGRMNTPGVGHGNWAWRVSAKMLGPEVAAGLAEMAEVYGRRG